MKEKYSVIINKKIIFWKNKQQKEKVKSNEKKTVNRTMQTVQ